MSEEFDNLGVACGLCGGNVYFETCRMSNPTNHDWVTAGECQTCGERTQSTCEECKDEDDDA